MSGHVIGGRVSGHVAGEEVNGHVVGEGVSSHVEGGGVSVHVVGGGVSGHVVDRGESGHVADGGVSGHISWRGSERSCIYTFIFKTSDSYQILKSCSINISDCLKSPGTCDSSPCITTCKIKEFNILMLKSPLNQERYKILLMIYFLIYRNPLEFITFV